jgi:hypothetical protein
VAALALGGAVSPRETSHSVSHRSCRQRALLGLIAGVIVIPALKGCTSISQTTSFPVAPSVAVMPTLTATAEETPEPSTTVAPTPSPFGTQIALVVPTQGESVFEPLAVAIEYAQGMENLSSGLYLIDRILDTQEGTERLEFLEVETGRRGLLIEIGTFLRADSVFFDGTRTWVLGGYPTTRDRFVIDLSREIANAFEVCTEGWDRASPKGERLAVICTEPGETQGGKVVGEVISLLNGELTTFELPSHPGTRRADNFIYWVSEESFIASAGLEEEPCLVNLADKVMRCSLSLRGKPILAVSPDWVVARPSRGNTQAIEIFSMSCFLRLSRCEPVASISSQELSSSVFHWSPDGSMLGVESGLFMGSAATEVGYYDAATWTYHDLGDFPPNSGIVGWCPDTPCMILSGQSTYLVQVDDGTKLLPHALADPIAVLQVP